MEEEAGIYREEVLTIMGVLADLDVRTRRILALLEDDEEEEEDDDSLA